MLDGKKDWKDIERDIQDTFMYVFAHYKTGLGSLKVFYIFVNFHDIWRKDSDKDIELTSDVIAYFDRERAKRKMHLSLVRVFPTQLAKGGNPWREVKTALDHFALDLNDS